MSMKDITKYLIGILFLFFFAFASMVDAGEIREHSTDPTVIAFVNSVEEGDAQMLRDYLVDHQEVTTLLLYSGGGSVSEGLEMMEIISLRGLNTHIRKDWKCYSICSFMWLAGKHRTVDEGGEIGVHQPYSMPEIVVEMSPKEYKITSMKTVAYMMWRVRLDVGDVDPYWWMAMLSEDGDNMYIFSQEELEYFVR